MGEQFQGPHGRDLTRGHAYRYQRGNRRNHNVEALTRTNSHKGHAKSQPGHRHCHARLPRPRQRGVRGHAQRQALHGGSMPMEKLVDFCVNICLRAHARVQCTGTVQGSHVASGRALLRSEASRVRRLSSRFFHTSFTAAEFLPVGGC